MIKLLTKLFWFLTCLFLIIRIVFSVSQDNIGLSNFTTNSTGFNLFPSQSSSDRQTLINSITVYAIFIFFLLAIFFPYL